MGEGWGWRCVRLAISVSTDRGSISGISTSASGVGASVVASRIAVLFFAQRVYPAGTVSRGEGGQGQGAQAHVLARCDELAEALLVGERIA